MKFNNLKKRGRIILVSLGVFLPVAFVLNFLWEYRDFEKQEHGPMLAHQWTYREIKKAVESGGQVPPTVDDFSTEFYKYHFQYYNPLAFGDPESIFFLCRRGRFYSTTFGDGKQATLTYWFVPGDLQRQRDYKFPKLGGRANLVKQLGRVVVFGTIGILICAFVRRLSLESKVATPPKRGRILFKSGMVLLCVAAACMILQCISLWFLDNALLDFLLPICSVLAGGASAFVFLLGRYCEQSDRLRHTVCLYCAVFIVLASFVVIPKIGFYLHERKVAQTESQILQLVSEVDALRLSTGRLPKDEAELVKLLGKPMPLSAWGTPMEYYTYLHEKLHDPNEPAYIIEAGLPRKYLSSIAYDSRCPDEGPTVGSSP